MAELIAVPQRMSRLPVDKHGRVVPFFVAWVDGVPDHRIADAARLRDAIRLKLCSLCGGHLGRFSTFVLGPMCTVTRTAPEPPSHLDCATYAALACPFLATPRMRRRDTSLPEGHAEPGGVMLRRNPGVTAVWTSRTAVPYLDQGKALFDVGDPTSVSWYAEGRPATRDEVLASLDSGMPGLREMAEAEGPRAVADLGRKHNTALAYLPRSSDPHPEEIWTMTDAIGHTPTEFVAHVMAEEIELSGLGWQAALDLAERCRQRLDGEGVLDEYYARKTIFAPEGR